MKLRVALSIVIFGAMVASLSAIPQKHPSIDPAAHEVDAKQLHSYLDHNGKLLVLDVRTPAEYAKGHIPGAINVPMAVLARKIRAMKVAKDTTIVTMCEHGGRSSRAAMELQKMGYHATSFCRIDSWQKDGYKIATGQNNPSPK
ncbi:MAG: rhodanese-like domain-containing protein [Acidobacteria bacterium]|nr:rhodanese-like domain-containing protein [Acidobacteriota bacterium]